MRYFALCDNEPFRYHSICGACVGARERLVARSGRAAALAGGRGGGVVHSRGVRPQPRRTARYG